ncbi:hypothetical protein ACTZGB_09275 [Yersinia bercovieri]|uniref:hypothetical protein n=1 Tax=Yersinia bercovieri TaxID=634 RepID=UPI0005E4B429|nr:hypothetical protein [Yersinia bercovieri]MDN0103167.1 hypothetical protein [Yersinia bercovieri]CNH74866.1 Uncharacterised protein [Yersinia bercovieri]
MSSYHSIAERIVSVIFSPESIRGVADGVLSIPVDLAYLGRGFIDTETRYQRQDETMRLIQAAQRGLFTAIHFSDAVEKVISLFATYVPQKKQDGFYRHSLFSVGGRMVTANFVSTIIARSILNTQKLTALQGLLRGGASSIILFGGMVERCIYKSMTLNDKNHTLYKKLRYPNDLDFLYFLLEDYISPFIDALTVQQREGDIAFNQIISIVEGEIKSRGILV